jgi:hypothetical protein
MKNAIICFLLVIFSVSLNGQVTDSSINYSSRHNGIIAGFGEMHLFSSDLNKLFQSKYHKSFDNNIKLGTIGIKYIIEVNRFIQFDGQFGYSYFIPQKVAFTDSLKQTLIGHLINFDFGADLFKRSEVFDLLFGTGIDFGRQRINVSSSNTSIVNSYYKNPFFAIKLFIEPKVIIKFVSISVRLEYVNDISNSQWKYKNQSLTPIGNTKTTGLILQGCLGYKF